MKIKGLTLLSLIFATVLKVKAALTQEQKDTLLNLHREARAAVNASNMKELNWDDNLASVAQNYASSCPGMKHSGTGPENIATRSLGTVTDLFNQFMEEKADFDNSDARQKYMDGSYGHYSQIVWADNTKVGCGLEDCSAKNGFGFELFMVCRYEEGNIIGYEVYALNTNTTTTTTTVTTTVTSTSTITSTTTSTTTITTPSNTNIESTEIITSNITTTTNTTTIAEPVITTSTSTNSTITTSDTVFDSTIIITTTSSKVAIPVATTTDKTKTTSSTSTTPIKTPDPNLPTGSINKCGEGVAVCARGYCCSEYGFCGTSDLHCGKGCQLGYGSCDSDPTNPPNKNPPIFTSNNEDNNTDMNDDDDDLPNSSSGKRNGNHIVCIKGFCLNNYGLWFLSSLLSYGLLNVVFGL